VFWVIRYHQINSAQAGRRHKIDVVQHYLVLNDKVGYLWRPNLKVTFSEKDRWLNAKLEGISPDQPFATDSYGFPNEPAAMVALKEREPDIIGLGDSFVHDAASVFYRVFGDHKYFYYNMAMHRQCPPQYNAILSAYALQHHPRHILYGVYANDFVETIDFEGWQRSGIDWFTYHSGTWAGVSPTTWAEQQLTTDQLNAARRDVWTYIADANRLCRSSGIDFTLMLIPSKNSTLGSEPEPNEKASYDFLRRNAEQAGIRVLDLRDVFARETDRQGLYWKSEGHWSYRGMEVAAKAYVAILHPLSGAAAGMQPPR
jgi:SGNH hydrolase-like domain, acetyltransferase AlgX